jgi:hypothetical protein
VKCGSKFQCLIRAALPAKQLHEWQKNSAALGCSHSLTFVEQPTLTCPLPPLDLQNSSRHIKACIVIAEVLQERSPAYVSHAACKRLCIGYTESLQAPLADVLHRARSATATLYIRSACIRSMIGVESSALHRVFNSAGHAEWGCMLVPCLGSAVAEAWLMSVLSHTNSILQRADQQYPVETWQ